jgi:hypothetical protein
VGKVRSRVEKVSTTMTHWSRRREAVDRESTHRHRRRESAFRHLAYSLVCVSARPGYQIALTVWMRTHAIITLPIATIHWDAVSSAWGTMTAFSAMAMPLACAALAVASNAKETMIVLARYVATLGSAERAKTTSPATRGRGVSWIIVCPTIYEGSVDPTESAARREAQETAGTLTDSIHRGFGR